jgi:hypothetical protein
VDDLEEVVMDILVIEVEEAAKDHMEAETMQAILEG